MSMTAEKIADAACKRAQRGREAWVRRDGPVRVAVGIDGRQLVIKAVIPGRPTLMEDDSEFVAAEGPAVQAVAGWLDGSPLPVADEPGNTAEVDEFFYKLTRAVALHEPSRLASQGWPDSQVLSEQIVIAGPEDARITVTARFDENGKLSGASWRGRRADGSSIQGHGAPAQATEIIAGQWAATLGQAAVITPVELAARRQALGLTQTELARMLRVRQNVISQWEAGDRAPRNPEEIASRLADLESAADDILNEAIDHGERTGRLPVWDTDAAYWTADSSAYHLGIPAAIHRVATARAAHILATQGTPVRIVSGDEQYGSAHE